GGDQRGQDRLPDAVRQIPDDERAPAGGTRERAVVPRARVGLDHLDRRNTNAQPHDEPTIDLEGDDAAGAARELARERALAGANLDDEVPPREHDEIDNRANNPNVAK